MKPIRRELLNGLFVLVLASLIHAAIEAFHINFNIQLWASIVTGVAIAVSGYVVFESLLSADGRDESTRQREEEWLKRVGTPARLELNQGEVGSAVAAVVETVKALTPGSDLTLMYYFGAEGGRGGVLTKSANAARQELYGSVLEMLKRDTLREYKRIICFDHEVLENDHELRSGVLRVGEGSGTIDSLMDAHCREMMETKGCSLYLAPVVCRAIVGLYGVNKASISIETSDRGAGSRIIAGNMFFCDPPNGEIIEQLGQMERATERRMVAVREIRFPEDAAPTTVASTG
jgi:hypothetical protein